MTLNKASVIIAFVVVGIWAVSVIGEMLVQDYHPNVGIYPALMVVLGGVFGIRAIRGDKEGS